MVGTTNIEESSDFYISYNEDGNSAYEFSITYMAPSSLRGRDVKSIPSYLYAPVNVRGRNTGPLTVRLDAEDSHTKMTLRSRRINQFNPVDTKDWLSSRDIFYISCKDTLLTNSFICVKRSPVVDGEEYIAYCVNSINKHNVQANRFMLFRLLRAAKRNPPHPMDKSEGNESLGIRKSWSHHGGRYPSVGEDGEYGLEMRDAGIKGKELAAEMSTDLETKM